MKQIAIIGLGYFGMRTLEKLRDVEIEILLVDKDSGLIERYKDQVGYAYVADVADGEALRKIVPQGLDVAIVDLGANLEGGILVTSALRKLGAKEIVVKAVGEERGEILELVGATRVVYPDREAADKVVPLLVSPNLFNYMPLGPNLVIAEVKLADRYVGKSLIEANLRRDFGVNVIAIRSEGEDEYRYFSADYRLGREDVLLVAGAEDDVIAFSGVERRAKKEKAAELLRRLLLGRDRHGR